MSSIKLAALLVVSTVMGCLYAPVMLFIVERINELARVVGGAA